MIYVAAVTIQESDVASYCLLIGLQVRPSLPLSSNVSQHITKWRIWQSASNTEDESL